MYTNIFIFKYALSGYLIFHVRLSLVLKIDISILRDIKILIPCKNFTSLEKATDPRRPMQHSRTSFPLHGLMHSQSYPW